MLWGHDARRETRLIVQPDKEGELRSGREEQARSVWERTASCLHFNRNFQLNSQPLCACLTPEVSLGGPEWPNFKPHEERWTIPLVLWANTLLGIMGFWWIGSREQAGRARISLSRLPELTVLEPRQLNDAQMDQARVIFERFQEQEFRPANEAYRDPVRQELDRAVLVELLGLDESVMEGLDILRCQWCAEPSVHGEKSTKP